MKILRREAYRRVPWRNGAGETEEIAVFPESTAADRMDWRISMAPVVAAGPFSVFPGIDRILTVIGGKGLRLTWPDGAGDPVECLPGSPTGFPGDAACHADLLDGPIVDLNVMTRRGRWQATVRPAHRVERRPDTAHHLIFAAHGPIEGLVDGVAFGLSDKDTLWLSAPFPDGLTLSGRWLDIQLTAIGPAL